MCSSDLAPAAPARPTSAEPAASSDARLDVVIEAQWKSVMSAMNGRKRMLGAFLEEITLVGVTEDALILSMDDLQRSVVDTGEHRPMLLEEMARVFGRPLELRVVKGLSKTQGRREKARQSDLQPIIDRAIEMFDGEEITRGKREGERN